jgi:hypothetical protein
LGRILNNEIYAKVKIGKHLSCEFKVNKGLRQGDVIDPLLFNVGNCNYNMYSRNTKNHI